MAVRLLHKSCHRLRFTAARWLSGMLRKPYWRLQGMTVGRGTMLGRMRVTWPHQVSLGADCLLEHDIFFKYDGIWSTGPSIVIGDGSFVGAGCEFNISSHLVIGADALIASGCKFIDHDHGVEPGTLIRNQPGLKAAIKLGRGVWLGVNVVVLKGVLIGEGVVVGAGAVVTQSVPANEIWAGVPARRIGTRTARSCLEFSCSHQPTCAAASR